MDKDLEQAQTNENEEDQNIHDEQRKREHAGLEDASVYGTDDYAGTLGGSAERVRSDQLPKGFNIGQAFDEYYDEEDDVSSDELDPSPLS